ncbi:MAG: class I tRNA ligase family protein [Actinobacteria bacterium]|nr:class I tRNA ligase family protein [Actinomycetota bacterium]
MTNRYLDGVVPEPPSPDELGPLDKDLQGVFEASFAQMEQAMIDIAPHEALKACWAFVRRCNVFVEEVTPWVLAKDPEKARRLDVVLYLLVDSLRLLALVTAPILPHAADELWRRVGEAGSVHDARFPAEARFGLLRAGAKVETGSPLFPRLEEPSPAGA